MSSTTHGSSTLVTFDDIVKSTTGNELRTLMLLIAGADREHTVEMKIQDMARALDVEPTSARRFVNGLEDKGLITWTRTGRASRYQVSRIVINALRGIVVTAAMTAGATANGAAPIGSKTVHFTESIMPVRTERTQRRDRSIRRSREARARDNQNSSFNPSRTTGDHHHHPSPAPLARGGGGGVSTRSHEQNAAAEALRSAGVARWSTIYALVDAVPAKFIRDVAARTPTRPTRSMRAGLIVATLRDPDELAGWRRDEERRRQRAAMAPPEPRASSAPASVDVDPAFARRIAAMSRESRAALIDAAHAAAPNPIERGIVERMRERFIGGAVSPVLVPMLERVIDQEPVPC